MTASIDIGGAPSRFPSGWNPGGTISAVPQERTAWMRETNGRRRLHLVTLWDGMPGLTPSLGGSLAEAAAVCLEDQGHGAVVDLTVEGHFEEVFALERSPVDEQMRNAHCHQETATENGACGVALAAICELTGLTVLRQSSRWTGVDYWLGLREAKQFQASSLVLEVSGIRKGEDHTTRARVRQKAAQMRKWGLEPPGLVAVVEFSRPVMRTLKI
jgi:hypothetical protein